MPVIRGVVEHGDARGRELGFPTANIPIIGPAHLDGVWAGTVEYAPGRLAVAAVSIGYRTTFYTEHGQRLLEAYLLDFSGDLYGRELTVNLVSYLRPQVTYTTAEDLIEQLHEDVVQARLWAANYWPTLAAASPRRELQGTPA
ncbi:riboflavin kinase [Arthrobacter sp. JZ12]|uniref:riboflavin kinase n=1 Tax=Arthrobacter sp. JZ12 TaxID=2654190 RepID=UPI002B469EDD|nr:riboflavin kinase [Arthrobacter sp. JZ12]WRH26236.1 riboflavin kinase [Arthrobacter sp. JZ12]